MSDVLNILVVDDEPGMQAGVCRALRNFTVQVRDVEGEVSFVLDQASSGEEALAKIAAAPPQILLLDHKLPGLSGLDVLEKIAPRTAAGDILTIMITAYASLETAIDATRRGAYDFLAKPFTPEELKNVVRKAAGRILLARRARQLAHEKRQVRFQFISVLAHELKAPLNAVEGYLRILRDRSAGDDPAAYERMLDRSLIRLEGMRKLILDLLDLTRIESGQKRRELAPLDLRQVAQACVEGLLPEARLRNITILAGGGAPAVLPADREEIEIIFNNLLSNAVKYNRDGGQVDVTITSDGPLHAIKVTDTGIGMTPEEAGRLFSDFARIKNEKTRDILGSGLGLSIVKKLAMLYGGDAAVSSTPGVGSIFTVTLNAANAESPDAPAGDAKTANGPC